MKIRSKDTVTTILGAEPTITRPYVLFQNLSNAQVFLSTQKFDNIQEFKETGVLLEKNDTLPMKYAEGASKAWYAVSTEDNTDIRVLVP